MPDNPTRGPAYGRRHFFKDSVLSVVKAAQGFVAERDAPPEKPAPRFRTDWLRPPGAAGEAEFADRCTKCGDCLKACPFGCIIAHPKDGLPIILADHAPCRLCEDFPCIAACATDALVPVASRGEIAMGLAMVSHGDCMAGQGCHACVSQCPTQALAMDFVEYRLSVAVERCVGCGVCQHTCTSVNDRIAIRVTPARLLGERASL